MRQIKKEYKYSIIHNGKLGYDVNMADIKPETYDFYFKNGLSFVFEDVCSVCKNEVCVCKRDFKQAFKDATDFMNN
jgi:hypothetical protein